MLVKTLSYSLLFLFSSAQTYACGTYEINGVVRQRNGHVVMITAEATKSEAIFEIPFEEQLKVIPYAGRPSKAKVQMSEAMDGTNGKITTIESINFRAPDPLAPAQDTYYKLLKKMDCKK